MLEGCLDVGRAVGMFGLCTPVGPFVRFQNVPQRQAQGFMGRSGRLVMEGTTDIGLGPPALLPVIGKLGDQSGR